MRNIMVTIELFSTGRIKRVLVGGTPVKSTAGPWTLSVDSRRWDIDTPHPVLDVMLLEVGEA